MKFIKKSEQGFTVTELVAALLLGAMLIGIITSVVFTLSSLNARASLRSNVGAKAFRKIQDYINLPFTDVPVGQRSNGYEIEDFSSEIESEFGLKDVVAKVYVEPESEIPAPIVTTENFTESVTADTEYVDGDEIEAPASGVQQYLSFWTYPERITDDIYSNYAMGRFWGIPANSQNRGSPSLDLGSAKQIGKIRVNWFRCQYSSDNFSIQGTNGNPRSSEGWNTVKGGFSDDYNDCSSTDRPREYSVNSSESYRHWRLFFNSQRSPYILVSELEVFSPGNPGDTVEQRGADAASQPGLLSYDSEIGLGKESNDTGRQSIGLLFQDIKVDQGGQIDRAYLTFTPTQNNSSAVSFLIKGVAKDSAPPWDGDFAVDNAIDSDGSDGLVGTFESVNWSPGPWDASDTTQNTQVEITAIVQEIINRGGWNSSNDIGIGIKTIGGSGLRSASRSTAPRLVIEWSKTSTTVNGNYVDADGDGDVDNPTLLRVTSLIEYQGQYFKEKMVYSTYMRKFGVGD